MEYLINKNKKKTVAHLWDGKDTLCKMSSTGGLNKEKYIVCNKHMGVKICTMCEEKKGR